MFPCPKWNFCNFVKLASGMKVKGLQFIQLFLTKKQTKFEITQFRSEIISYNFPSILLLWHFQRQNKRYKMLLFLHGLYHYICCAGFSYNLFSSFPPYLGANKLLPAAHKFRMTMINQEKGLLSFVFVSELFKGR